MILDALLVFLMFADILAFILQIFELPLQVFRMIERRLAKRSTWTWRVFAQSNNLSVNTGWRGLSYSVSGRYRDADMSLKGINSNGLHTVASLEDYRIVNEAVIHQALDDLLHLMKSHSLSGQIKVEAGGRKFVYKQVGIETSTTRLQLIFGLLADLISIYPHVVKVGGEAIPSLQELADENSYWEDVAIQLLRDIAQETKRRLQNNASGLLCPHCLARFSANKVKISKGSVAIYGCRMCGQSREFWDWPGKVVAVLDDKMLSKISHKDYVLRANWLNQRSIFDFDEVEIIQATDEDVERFAVQVGNDTDDRRSSRYQQMSCVIGSTCHLSENTLRILQHMFGQVSRLKSSPSGIAA